MPIGPRCQCPLGLIPHFYTLRNVYKWRDEITVSMPSRAYTSFLPYNVRFENFPSRVIGVNALSGLYLISTDRRLLGYQKVSHVSMPSRAYTSFLRYPFKNLGFMRFPEPVFAGIYQNILTTAVFHAC